MGISTDSLIKGVRKATGQDEDDLPDIDALLYLNQSYWELLDKYPFREKEVRGTWPTVIGTRIYNVPNPFEALRHLAVVNPDTMKHEPLRQMGHDEYEQTYVDTVDNRGSPTRYIREGNQMLLWPTPDKVYTIVMRYWTTLEDLSASNDPNMPQNWHELVKFGGIWRVFVDAGDYQRANAMKKLQENLINSTVPVEAKEEEDNSRAHLEVIRADYP